MSLLELVTPEEIRKVRKNLKLTQKELAKRAKVSQSLIARIENKSIDPRLSTIKRIVDALTQDKEKKTASDIMHSPVIIVNFSDSVRTAVDLMKKYNISQLPVLKDKKIIGCIKESTILDSIMKNGNFEEILSSLVFEIMENKFTTLNSSTLITKIINQLSKGESAVLIADDEKLVGIITKIDVISSAINLKIKE